MWREMLRGGEKYFNRGGRYFIRGTESGEMDI